MARKIEIEADEQLVNKTEEFLKKTDSNMFYRSDFVSDLMSFDWLNEIEFACPYIDNIISMPRPTLIKEEDVVKIEKVKKISVASVKDLSIHTHYIDKIDPITEEVEPSKLLIERYEETINIYENRLIFTLLDNLNRFMVKKERLFADFDSLNSKTLEYKGKTKAGNENINIELKISSNEIEEGEGLDNELDDIKKRIKFVKDYMSSWFNSDFYITLEKLRVPPVTPPIRKTNMILKNPNYQVAVRLWDFIQTYEEVPSEAKKLLETEGDNVLRELLDDSFLINYFVLDSVSKSKKTQKEKLANYAVVMLKQYLQKIINILLNNGIEISDERIMEIIASSMKEEKIKRVAGTKEIEDKFRNIMDDYLEGIKEL